MNKGTSVDRRFARARMFEQLEGRLLFAFGQTDTTFGDAGRVTVNFTVQNQSPAVQQILIDSNNKILAGGTTGLTRLSSGGVVDTAFGTNGKIALSSAATFVSEAIDPTNNKIYVLVSASTGTGLFRYSSTGQIDVSYGQSGTVRVTSSTSFTPQALAVQADGKVLVAGVFKTDNSDGRKVRVYRLTTAGMSDTGFGASGSEEFNFGAGTFLAPTIYDNVSGIKVLSGGKILVGGSTVDYAPEVDDPSFTPATFDKADLAVARLTTAGQLDTTYNTTGITLSDYATSDQINQLSIGSVEQNAFTVRSDGSALVAGFNGTAVTAEFNPSGVLKYSTSAPDGSQLYVPQSLSVLSDGRAVLVARAHDVVDNGFTFTYISSTGVLGNVVYTSDNDDTTDDIDATEGIGTSAISSDGELLVGGGTGIEQNNAAFEIAKFKVGNANDPRPDNFANARANDIVKDSQGGLHVAYFDAATTHMVYVYRAPNGLWNAPVVVDTGANAGQYVSIGVNSKNQPGIAYFDGNAGDLKLAQFNGKKWTLETVDSKGSVGLYPSFTYDNADEPVVTYYNKGKGKLTFALKNATTGKWGYENVDASGDNVGRSSVLEASPNTGRYTVAYVDNTTGSVMWAGHQKGGVWQVKAAAKTKGGADFLSMAYDNAGSYQPAISYYDAFASDLKITYFQNNGFIVKTLATSGAQGLYTQTFFGNGFGDPDVFSYSKSANKITLFSDTVVSTPVASDIVPAGGKFLSVDWNGFTTDMAYFDAGVSGIIVRPGPALSSVG